MRKQNFKNSFNMIIILNLDPNEFTNLTLRIDLYNWNPSRIVIVVYTYDILDNSNRNILTLT